MTISSLFVLILSSLVTLSPVRSDPFEFYVLSLQWPGTYCKKNPCALPIPKLFTVHGLWPTNITTTTQVEYCRNTRFPIPPPNKPSPVLGWKCYNDLLQYWPDLNGNNLQFWGTQWTKHGSCAPYKNPQDYFSTVMKLYKTTFKADNLLMDLQAQSVVPIDTKQGNYTVVELAKVFKDILGGGNKDIFLHCISHPPLQALAEVRVYMDLNFQVVSSPKGQGCTSSDRAFFPPVV